MGTLVIRAAVISFVSNRSDGERDWCGGYGNIYPSGRKGQESGLGHNHGTGKEVLGKVMQ